MKCVKTLLRSAAYEGSCCEQVWSDKTHLTDSLNADEAMLAVSALGDASVHTQLRADNNNIPYVSSNDVSHWFVNSVLLKN